MSRTKRRHAKTKRSPAKAPTQATDHGAGKRGKRVWIGAAFVALLAASAVGGVLWAQVGQRAATERVDAADHRDAAQQADPVQPAESDVYYVNNRQCAMTGSELAEKDLGLFESRVVYDGPIERFQGKTLVFNQCCSMCIESFPKKWAVERDQIMAKFGLANLN